MLYVSTDIIYIYNNIYIYIIGCNYSKLLPSDQDVQKLSTKAYLGSRVLV